MEFLLIRSIDYFPLWPIKSESTIFIPWEAVTSTALDLEAS
jgi:hypothetical protein